MQAPRAFEDRDDPGGSRQTPTLLDRRTIEAALYGGAAVITPNRRLARALKQTFDHAQRELGARTWASADVLPWPAWLARLHADLADDRPALLSSLQELVLWERVIAAAMAGEPLADVRSLARVAADAWQRLQAHASADALAPYPMNVDQTAFRGWSTAFASELRARRAVTAAELPARLARDVTAGLGRLPARIVLAGFGPLAAQARRLTDALRARGVGVDVLEPAVGLAGTVPARVVCADLHRQWPAAAAWARTRLAANPGARIGIVVPDLATQREALVRVLEEALCPSARLSPEAETGRPFNVSLGRPLSSAPLVATALLLFDLLLGTQPIAAIGSLLRSPFIGAGDAGHRARLDATLREEGAFEVGLRGLLRRARSAALTDAAGTSAGLAAALAAIERALVAAPRVQLPSRWATLLFDVLRAAGFPGVRALDSAEYQTHQRWREVLAALATLDGMLGAVALGAVVARLRRIAADTVFQPESADVPVQVLGVLESTHLRFDHLWVANLDDSRWPLAASPNPLLPLALQKAWGEPDAAQEFALLAARRQQAGWTAAAGELVLSHALADGDTPCRPSALVASLPAVALAALDVALAPPLATRLRRGLATEAVVDRRGPPVDAGAASACAAEPPADPAGGPGAEPAAGGTRILTDQAACAFRAFAVHRLHAQPLGDPAPGLDAMTRGELVHAALEHFWRPLGSQQALLELDDAQVDARLQAAIDHALARLRARRPEPPGPRLCALEAERLRRLLHAWLDVERRRPAFEVVTVETRRDAQIGGLRLRVKPDRLDRVDGALLLIDYKTGRVSPADWRLPRPDEPQLPLYAVTAGERISALAFAQLRPGETKLAALAERDGLLPDAEVAGSGRDPRPWDALLGDWRLELERLAADYLAGVAAVDPKDRRRSCEYCALPVLCRIGERGAAAAGGDDA